MLIIHRVLIIIIKQGKIPLVYRRSLKYKKSLHHFLLNIARRLKAQISFQGTVVRNVTCNSSPLLFCMEVVHLCMVWILYRTN